MFTGQAETSIGQNESELFRHQVEPLHQWQGLCIHIALMTELFERGCDDLLVGLSQLEPLRR
jgi:hypothetical protein